MRIRLLKSFSGYRAGQEFDWSDGMARIYIARGMAERVEERGVEAAMVEERAERAAVQPSIRRKVK